MNVNAITHANAEKRKVPAPDIKERGEMACFDASQALHKILTGIMGGMSGDVMRAKIINNGNTAIKNSKLNGKQLSRMISDIEQSTKQAHNFIGLSERIKIRVDAGQEDVRPGDVQKWYFDYCVIAFNKRIEHQKILTGK